MLGSLEVDGAFGPLPVRRGRAERLLLSLLLRDGQPVRSTTLYDEIWPEERPVHEDNALQVLVSYLRRRFDGEPELSIERSLGAYRLRVPDDVVDQRRFRSAVRRLDDVADPRGRLRVAETALGLWRGTPYAEIADEPHARAAVVRLDQLRVTAVEHRARALLELGRAGSVADDLEADVLAHPFREQLLALRVLALYRSGRQAEALAALAGARRALRDELGLDPGPELRRLEAAVLDQAPELDWPGRPVVRLAPPVATDVAQPLARGA